MIQLEKVCVVRSAEFQPRCLFPPRITYFNANGQRIGVFGVVKPQVFNVPTRDHIAQLLRNTNIRSAVCRQTQKKS